MIVTTGTNKACSPACFWFTMLDITFICNLYRCCPQHTVTMSDAIVGLCTVELYLAGLTSLKEKRSILKSLLSRLHNTFNITAAEIDAHDRHQSAVIAFAVVSNSSRHAQQVLENAAAFVEERFPEVEIVRKQVEIL